MWLISRALWVLFQSWRFASSEHRQQLLYIFLGFLLAFMGGGAAFLPIYGIPIEPYSVFFVPVGIVVLTAIAIRYRLMDIRVAVASTGIFFIVYAIALGVPFYLYRMGQHFPALAVLFVLATAAPFIYARLRREAEERIFKGQLDHQQALTRAVQEQLIESEKMAAVGYLVGGLAHQLRNRFTSMVFFSDIAGRKVSAAYDNGLKEAERDEIRH